jgi:dsRNA-specific ribonuclease
MMVKNPDGKEIGRGISTSKVNAAQIAAKMALDKLGQIKEIIDESDDEYYNYN